VVRVVGHEEKVISEQHVGHRKIWSASERAFHPVCYAANVVQVGGKQQRGEGTSLFDAKRWLHRSCLIPIQQHIFISMVQVHTHTQIFKDGQDMVRHLATALMVPQLVSWNTILSLFEVIKRSIQL